MSNPICDSLKQQGLDVTPIKQDEVELRLSWNAQTQPILGNRVLVLLPDIHLSTADEGDVFAQSDAERSKRLLRFLRALANAKLAVQQQNKTCRVVQLGDFYDVWRAYPEYKDHPTGLYDRIESSYGTAIDTLIRDLDVRVCVGNHDANMGRFPPWWARSVDGSSNGRLAYAHSFAQQSVLAFHGHQVDLLERPMEGQGGDDVVRVATLAAQLSLPILSPLIAPAQHVIDWAQDAFADGDLSQQGVLFTARWARSETIHDEAGFRSPLWCDRIGMQHVRRVLEASAVKDSVKLVLLGHSHRAGVSAVRLKTNVPAGAPPAPARFVPVVDFGSWAWGRTQFGVAIDGEVSLWSLHDD